MDFDTNKYDYNFKNLTYLTMFKRNKKFIKIIEFIDKNPKFAPQSKYFLWSARLLINVPNLKLNFSFENDIDKILWTYKSFLNEIFERNIFSKKDFYEDFIITFYDNKI
ncbi:hypothetical protein ACW95P_02445 [Candidatus Mycoplasma pogonae]